MTVGIVGLGLIGGSMARAVRRFTAHRVLGADIDGSVVEQALADGVIDGILDEESLPVCDLVLPALYPEATIAFVREKIQFLRPGACLVDLCGVKRVVCEALAPLAQAQGVHFIGGHPMAGREKSGYAAASAELFLGASMILTPREDVPQQVRKEAEAFFLSLGFGQVRITDEQTHDRMIAYTSQLAHVLSNAYVKSPLALEHRGFSAGSFQDLTRVAALNTEMWTQLFLDNRDYLAQEIAALCERLSEYGAALQAGDDRELRRLLQEGCERKAQTLE